MAQRAAALTVDADSAPAPPSSAAPAPPAAAPQVPATPRVPAVRQVLPSERLTRLAELAAAAADPAGATAAVLLSEQAMADVLAAVDASTAPNTKRAYASDWARFTDWTTQRGSVRCRGRRWWWRTT